MNRKNIDDRLFLDLDELVSVQIVQFQFPEATSNVLKDNGFMVVGKSKNGLSFEGLFIDKQSGSDKACVNWIINNWVNGKK